MHKEIITVLLSTAIVQVAPLQTPAIVDSRPAMKASQAVQTIEKKLPAPQSEMAEKNVPVAPAASTQVSGSKQEWMAAAGIPQSDWQYVDYIVSKESSWRPDAVNAESGACSLVQSLPCSKVGPNWRDPVVALKWQYSYVQQRYGGYAGAYNFWLKNSWY